MQYPMYISVHKNIHSLKQCIQKLGSYSHFRANFPYVTFTFLKGHHLWNILMFSKDYHHFDSRWLYITSTLLHGFALLLPPVTLRKPEGHSNMHAEKDNVTLHLTPKYDDCIVTSACGMPTFRFECL